MADDRLARAGSAGYALVLAAFVALKLTGTVSWSWWWVLSPVWLMFVLAIAIALGYVVLYLAGVGALRHWTRRRRRRP